MTLWSLVAVALGGALGTLGRVGADLAMTDLPWGQEIATLGVNLLGALALGVATGHGLRHFSVALRDGLTVGVIGSYTTMSGVALVVNSGGLLVGVAYLVITFGLGLLVAWAGYRLGHRWVSRPTSGGLA